MEKHSYSATSIQEIKDFLLENFNIEWDGKSPIMLSKTDCFVYLGQVPDETRQIMNEFNLPTIEVISWLNEFRFDVLTGRENIILTNGVTEYMPINPYHNFV